MEHKSAEYRSSESLRSAAMPSMDMDENISLKEKIDSARSVRASGLPTHS